MQFVFDPVKSKRVFILMLILTIVFFIGSGTLGYLYYRERKTVNEKQSLLAQKEQEIATLQKQIGDLSGSSTSTQSTLDELRKSNKILTDQVNSDKAKMTKALAYNEVFKFVNQVIETHNGFDGWTDAEFQAGKVKAEATGNTAYVSTINWAWYDHSVPQLTRALRFWKETAANIESSLK